MKHVIVRFFGKDERRTGSEIMPTLSFVGEDSGMYPTMEEAVKDKKEYEALYPESEFEVMGLIEVEER